MKLVPRKNCGHLAGKKMYARINYTASEKEGQADYPDENSDDKELFHVQKSLYLEEDPSDVSGIFSYIGVSPIKRHSVSTSAKVKQGKR